MMREALGDAYVAAARGCYGEVSRTVDFVMYWCHRAAARAGDVEHFGFITTNSIVQTFNRQVVQAHTGAACDVHQTGGRPSCACPWSEEKGSPHTRNP